MSINPNDFDIPEGFRHYDGDPAEDTLGPFFGKVGDRDSRQPFAHKRNIAMAIIRSMVASL